MMRSCVLAALLVALAASAADAQTRVEENVFVDSDSRKAWRLSFSGSGNQDEEGGWSARFGPSLQLQPSARLQTSIGANYNTGRTIAQWIANEDTDEDGADDRDYRDEYQERHLFLSHPR